NLSNCPRVPSFQWNAGVIYDSTPSNHSDDAQIDITPELPAIASPAPSIRAGYVMLGADGKRYGFGDAPHWSGTVKGGAADASRRDGTGEWITDGTGRVYTRGRAAYKGGGPGFLAGERVTTMSATPTSNGYWLFTNLGRAFAYGDAHFYGDMRNAHLN